ncbi:uncharacterized protein N7479_003901 [Penicillium vulpinum]|uniref:uncharacterized protein n=1 Tax=Penicillium vulpinum TaxID=29845 RepID=UPI0025481A47|nr:uncharacterized protein N7479_003901 [Penicillium vulpinum]KAJ5964025.1 hypothetical protein N7479_003901 [Penicillium vulpinum]
MLIADAEFILGTLCCELLQHQSPFAIQFSALSTLVCDTPTLLSQPPVSPKNQWGNGSKLQLR